MACKKNTSKANHRRPTVNVISLGCSKNLVDSERVLSMLENKGFEVHHEWDKNADIVVLNTCGFIGDAKEESVDTIMNLCSLKCRKKIKRIIVMGCLSQRYPKELQAEIPEIDAMYGKFDWVKLADDLAEQYATQLEPLSQACGLERKITTPPHYTYIKISEGCNRFCAFCAIPLITDRLKSRTIDDIVAEVTELTRQGVKEFNIIAQDLSAYGVDIYKKHTLPELIERLAQIDGVEWLRLHYGYPSDFPIEVMDVMARYPNVCAYIDIALQHISDKVLQRMRRHIDGATTRKLLAEMRRRVPNLHIRTTLMVGFPGETEEDFEELCRFVEEQRFERMGAFAYCEEDGTYAQLNYPDDIPEEVKQRRLDRLMAIQEEISAELQQKKVGQKLRVIIDREEDEFFVGRTEWDSPEVDPEVIINKSAVEIYPGDFVDVQVNSATPFELIATPVLPSVEP